MRPQIDIPAALAGQRLLITGATGFVGKVLVEKLLYSVPEIERLWLLIRPDAERTAAERLESEIVDSPIMARLRARHGDGWRQWVSGKLVAVAGDLERDRFGLGADAYRELCGGLNQVVAAAASVRFDERLDRALELNTRGALRALELARDAGGVPLLQVSTCYVSGERRGEISERIERPPAAAPADPEELLTQLEHECARRAADPAATDAVWIRAGREIATRYGYADVYTLTKGLAERLLEARRDAVPLTVLRPAIVESAHAEPIPGWIETVRVADPLLVAYGRGRTREIPGARSQPLELVPVDLVVNALLAALADAGDPRGGVRVYQVGSRRNPVSLGELLDAIRAGLERRPFRDEAGRPIAVDKAHFVAPRTLARRLTRRMRRWRTMARLAAAVGRSAWARRLEKRRRLAEHFRGLIETYRPYLTHDAAYADRETRALWGRLTPESRAAFSFDVAAIDWPHYLATIHLPGIARFALRADEPPPPPRPVPGRERRAELERAHRRVAAAGSLFEVFAATADALPVDQVALQTFRDGRWLRYTYRQAINAAATLSRSFVRRFGVTRGDRVAIWATGRPEWTITALAVHRLGATVVPLDPQWPAEEVGRAARWVGAKVICAAPELAPALADRDLPSVVLASPFVPEPDAGPVFDELPEAVGERTDVAAIVFTSGTTVAPKAVPLTHGNLLANVADLVPIMDLCRERTLSVLPIHHVFELTVGHWVPLAGGSTISYVAEIKPAEISWMMAATEPTVLVAVPRLLELLDNGIRASVAAKGRLFGRFFDALFVLSKATGGRLSRVLFGAVHRRFGGALRRIVTGGSALDPDLGRRFAGMGFEVAEGYGLTETAPVLTVNPWGATRFGSAGHPLPGVDLRIVDGQVEVRGANVMSGYLDDPEATAQVMRDGWFATGDLGRLAGDGYLFLSGRAKETIVTAAGKNVHPEEVERRYRGLPGVEELVVVGLPRAAGGEQVTAVVVPPAAAGAAEIEAIRTAVAERSADVPSYQRISRLEIWRGDLPKTTTLKVRRAALRHALLAGERGREAAPAEPRSRPAAPRNGHESELLSSIARLTRTRADHLLPSSRLSDLGVDSLTRVELVEELESRFGLRLDDATAGRLDRVSDLIDLIPAGSS